ncbi:hypothetical protein SDC9_102729 [bioreactor metagenome]|uniref:Uncharacterized protein n=1 Tax=bioreactor metagenome TaxID=1076179 RepID=A0A645AUG2_9ZZZZ
MAAQVLQEAQVVQYIGLPHGVAGSLPALQGILIGLFSAVKVAQTALCNTQLHQNTGDIFLVAERLKKVARIVKRIQRTQQISLLEQAQAAHPEGFRPDRFQSGFVFGERNGFIRILQGFDVISQVVVGDTAPVQRPAQIALFMGALQAFNCPIQQFNAGGDIATHQQNGGLDGNKLRGGLQLFVGDLLKPIGKGDEFAAVDEERRGLIDQF